MKEFSSDGLDALSTVLVEVRGFGSLLGDFLLA